MYMQGATPTVSGAFDTNGDFFPLDSLPQAFNRNGAGVLQSIVATSPTNTYTQTYTYTNSLVTSISGWVKGAIV